MFLKDTNDSFNEEYQYDIPNDLAYLILSHSKFIIGVKYEKAPAMTVINYKEIVCENKELKIEEVKNFSSEDLELNEHYKKFKNDLTNLEYGLSEKYKKEKKTEIILEIKMRNYGYYRVDSKLTINDGIEDQEKKYDFIDEDILHHNTYSGVGCLIDEIE